MKEINWWLYVITMFLYILTIASCIVVILKENRNPIRSISWIIALIFLPVIGLVFYIFFGRSLRGQRMISRMNKQKMITNMAPKLVPIFSHRYIPFIPNDLNIPIFSIVQSDIIYYGRNLISYLEVEFKLKQYNNNDITGKYIDFWSDFI